MSVGLRARTVAAALGLGLGVLTMRPHPVVDAQTLPTFKIAYYNIQAGKGEAAIPGHAATFVEGGNCTDPALPMNAWGTGLIQSHLRASVGDDPRVVALGLGEAWTTVCGSPENVRRALNWRARSSERNGVALVARHGFTGPEEWVQLDTSLNPNPSDTMWVLRQGVCLDSACGRSIDVFVAHWMGLGIEESLDRQGRQTVEFLRTRGGSVPHVLVADLNAWEGVPVCSQIPESGGLRHLRAAGYIDAWPAIHGNAEGFTGMVNRADCGTPMGYPFKRIDYAWTPPGFAPLSMARFGLVPPGDAAPSDHYGIIAEYPWPGAPPPPPPLPPPPPPPASPSDVGSSAEIVIHARSARALVGAWRLEDDPTAAASTRVSQPDAGAPKIATPLAQPRDYFDLTFDARAGTGYRLWIRGRAAQNHWANDSVFVQFSGSVSESGAPRWRIGTASAAAVVLEECGGCALDGWGWQDNGYGLAVLGPLVFFETSGVQTVRVQAREDGIAIDQLVLSSSDYLERAPGSATRDNTILPATPGAPPEAPGAPGPTTRAEILIRASGVATLSGAWRSVNDPTAAGGSAVTHADAGAPKLVAPLAAAVDFVEFTFAADAAQPYRLWLRGRADSNHWSNDSVYVQFSGTVTTAGVPVYRIGSASATTVNLEDGSGAGVSGWGWQDNGYGVGVLGPLILFETGGPQTIRIQTREDGFRIDQIVLSSSRYLSSAPGALVNDSTIIP